MKTLLGAVAIAALLGATGMAQAEEAMGTIQSINEETRIIILDNGTTFAVEEGVSLQGLMPGTEVQVSYEEVNGENVASEVVPSGE